MQPPLVFSVEIAQSGVEIGSLERLVILENNSCMYCTLYTSCSTPAALIVTIVSRELCIPLPDPAVNKECDLAECSNPELMGDKQAQPLASCT
jgi:hypothetical protein